MTSRPAGYEGGMGLLIALIVIAVVLAVIGLAVAALKWLLIIAGILIVVAIVRGFLARGSSRAGGA